MTRLYFLAGWAMALLSLSMALPAQDIPLCQPTVVVVECDEVDTDTANHVVDDERPPAHPGAKSFAAYCAACHQLGGQGVEGRVPPLDDSPWVAGPEERLVRIVLNGLHGPIEIHEQVYNLEMPSFRLLFKDEDIAAILSYVRHQYGKPSPAVTPETVARIRKETEDKIGYWTVKELLELP